MREHDLEQKKSEKHRAMDLSVTDSPRETDLALVVAYGGAGDAQGNEQQEHGQSGACDILGQKLPPSDSRK